MKRGRGIDQIIFRMREGQIFKPAGYDGKVFISPNFFSHNFENCSPHSTAVRLQPVSRTGNVACPPPIPTSKGMRGLSDGDVCKKHPVKPSGYPGRHFSYAAATVSNVHSRPLTASCSSFYQIIIIKEGKKLSRQEIPLLSGKRRQSGFLRLRLPREQAFFFPYFIYSFPFFQIFAVNIAPFWSDGNGPPYPGAGSQVIRSFSHPPPAIQNGVWERSFGSGTASAPFYRDLLFLSEASGGQAEAGEVPDSRLKRSSGNKKLFTPGRNYTHYG